MNLNKYSGTNIVGWTVLGFRLGFWFGFLLVGSSAVDFKHKWTTSDIKGELAAREERQLEKIEKLEAELEELRK